MKNAIIGLGTIGKVHAKVLGLQEKGITALCDIDVAAAERIKGEYAPDAAVYTDWKQMLDEVQPEVVHICTPHYLHAEMVIEALGRGINVLCEKPLCIRKEDIGRILEAEKNSTAQLGVCQQNRSLETNAFVKDYLSDKTVVGAHGTVAWNRDEKYYNSGEWRGTQALEGGGVLINQALHTLDIVQWLCGMPNEVIAIKDNFTLRDVIEVEDTITARFFGETPFSFFATNASPCTYPVQVNLTLSNKERITILPDMLMINGEIKIKGRQMRTLGKACYGVGHEPLIEDFYDCVATGRHFMIDGQEAMKVVRLILAAYESNGERISVN